MKRIIVILIAILYFLLLLNLTPQTKVLATSECYYRVLKEKVYIYTDSNLNSPMFIVPYTYYVKCESINGNIARVVYGNEQSDYPVIIGYMNLNDLTLTQTTPLNPFAILKISTSNQDVLFSDISKKKPYFNLPSETFMIYYGEILDSEANVMYMVYCKNKLGYVDKNCINSFSIPLNQDPLPEPEIIEPSTPSDSTNIEKPTSELGEHLQILIIVGISTVCISVVYALFKPTKNKTAKQNEYFEESE